MNTNNYIKVFGYKRKEEIISATFNGLAITACVKCQVLFNER